MPLAVGDIVTVMLEDCRFYENQGQVKEIVNDEDPDGNIGVQFGRWCETLACTEEHAIIRFHESELRKDPGLDD